MEGEKEKDSHGANISVTKLTDTLKQQSERDLSKEEIAKQNRARQVHNERGQSSELLIHEGTADTPHL